MSPEYLSGRMLAYAASGKVPEAVADFDQAMGLLGPEVSKVLGLLTRSEGCDQERRVARIARGNGCSNSRKDPISIIALGQVMLAHNDFPGALKVLAPLSASPGGLSLAGAAAHGEWRVPEPRTSPAL